MSEYIQLWQPWTEIEPYKLPNTNKILQGYSLAGLRTNYFIGPDLMLDAGISAPFSAKYILITHGHADHIANLPFHLYVKSPETVIQIYCPKPIVKLIDNYICSMFQLSDGNQDMIPFGYKIIGVDETTEPVEILLGKQPHLLEFYKCVHSVPCIGYGISIIKNKLKSDYSGLSSAEIKKLKFDGIEITQTIYEPELFFSGDTTHELFEIESNKKILTYRNILIECTFVFDEDISHANEKKHMGWSNLKPYIEKYPQTNWILSHFSQKYRKEQLEIFFEKENLPNIKLWINVK